MDDIMSWMLLWGPPELWTTILLLFKTIWMWELIPEAWKIALTKFIPKAGCPDLHDLSEHRPLTLRSILGKLYTQVMLFRLKALLDASLPKPQIGFQSQMSSDLALWLAQMLAHEQHREGREAWFLLCDWSKCFDRVWRSLTLLLLHAAGVTGKLWLAVEAWINGTTVTAFFIGVSTDPFPQLSGLGQGCVLSAFLFLIWMSTLTECAPCMSDTYPYKGLIIRAYAHSLPKSWGMRTDFSPEGEAVPALILADDTTLLANSRRHMMKLIDKLEAWKRTSRAIASAKKFQLCVHLNTTSGCRDSAVVGVRGGEHTIVVDGMEIPAAPTAKLLGGILCHPNDVKSSKIHLSRKAAMHRATLSKIDSLHGREVAHMYSMACPEAQILGAAAADPNLFAQHEFMLSIQRTLWSDSHSSAIGSHPAAKNSIVDRLIPGIPWDLAIRARRIKLWQRLATNTRVGSWPHYAALKIKANVALDASKARCTGGWVDQLDRDLSRWVTPGGLLTVIPPPRTSSHTRRLRSDATVMGSHMHDSSYDAMDVVDLESAFPSSGESLSFRRWQQANYRGDALDMSMFEDCVDMDCVMHCLDPAEELWSSKAWAALHDESDWPEDNRCASEWKRNLNLKVVEEAEVRWRLEQTSYAPHDPRLGRGEMALWNRLKPSPKVSDALLILDHRKLSSHQRDAVTRLWAGCTLTSSAWCCKRRTVAVWRSASSSDAQKEQAVLCLCGVGPQDSLHCLECTLPALVAIHDGALLAAHSYLLSCSDFVYLVPWSSRRGRHAVIARALLTWERASRTRRLELTLGARDDGIHSSDHVSIVSLCAVEWAKVEDSWA